MSEIGQFQSDVTNFIHTTQHNMKLNNPFPLLLFFLAVVLFSCSKEEQFGQPDDKTWLAHFFDDHYLSRVNSHVLPVTHMTEKSNDLKKLHMIERIKSDLNEPQYYNKLRSLNKKYGFPIWDHLLYYELGEYQTIVLPLAKPDAQNISVYWAILLDKNGKIRSNLVEEKDIQQALKKKDKKAKLQPFQMIFQYLQFDYEIFGSSRCAFTEYASQSMEKGCVTYAVVNIHSCGGVSIAGGDYKYECSFYVSYETECTPDYMSDYNDTGGWDQDQDSGDTGGGGWESVEYIPDYNTTAMTSPCQTAEVQKVMSANLGILSRVKAFFPSAKIDFYNYIKPTSTVGGFSNSEHAATDEIESQKGHFKIGLNKYYNYNSEHVGSTIIHELYHYYLHLLRTTSTTQYLLSHPTPTYTSTEQGILNQLKAGVNHHIIMRDVLLPSMKSDFSAIYGSTNEGLMSGGLGGSALEPSKNPMLNSTSPCN